MLSCLLPFSLFVLWIGFLQDSHPIQVSDDFESGNLGEWRIEEENRLVFQPHKDYDQDRVNTAVTWFYGKLSNVLHRDVEIVIEKLDYTVYDGKKGDILPFGRNTVPVFSYDGEHWERFSNCAFDKEQRCFRIRHVFSRDEAWIAYIPPYTFGRLDSLLSEVRAHPAVGIETIGKSVEGKPIYLVSLAGPGIDSGSSPVVWIVARQHAFESGGSWAIEGLVRFLTSSEPEASAILNRMVFKICPMLNPDGVISGNTRFNTRGVDLNRHWSSSDPFSDDMERAPEIASVKSALRSWTKTKRFDLWINIHNNDMVWNEEGDYIRFAPAEKEARARKLEEILRRNTIFDGPFFLTPNQETTEAVIAREFDALGLLMEMKTGYLENQNRWTGIDLFLEFGEDLARSLSELY